MNLCFIVTVCITLFICLKYCALQKKYRRQRLLTEALENYSKKLETQNKRLLSRKPAMQIPKGTIEAVKYAMIHNHPDNGGSTEKFILYKDCYNKLTGGTKR